MSKEKKISSECQKEYFSKDEVVVLFNRFIEFIAHHDPDEWEEYLDKILKIKLNG